MRERTPALGLLVRATCDGSSIRRRLAPGRVLPNAKAQLQPSQIRALREAQCNSLDRLSVAAFVRRSQRGSRRTETSSHLALTRHTAVARVRGVEKANVAIATCGACQVDVAQMAKSGVSSGFGVAPSAGAQQVPNHMMYVCLGRPRQRPAGECPGLRPLAVRALKDPRWRILCGAAV